jgi:hypothetical protein
MAEDKRSIYNRSGLGHRIGYGQRPALLVVDMQIGFTAPERSPLAGNLDAQVAAINKLIPAARKNGVPIVFTVVGYDPKVPADGGLWPEKAPSLLELKLGSELVELDPRIHRAPEDMLLVKKYASAFLGTPLAATLVTRASTRWWSPGALPADACAQAWSTHSPTAFGRLSRTRRSAIARRSRTRPTCSTWTASTATSCRFLMRSPTSKN